MTDKVVLIALDSVGIDPLGTDRPESVYSESVFLFPKRNGGGATVLPDAPVPGVLVETDVTDGQSSGAIECALTYTSLFTGASAVRRRGLMQGLGIDGRALERMIDDRNLFREFSSPCLANAVFPVHLPFFGRSYAEDLVPSISRETVETEITFRGRPVRLTGREKHGFAELYTLAEINQNVFVYAARNAGPRLRTWDDVRRGEALSSSMTNELESEFDFSALGLSPLPPRTPEQAAGVLASLSERHDFVFHKYQIPDLVSHTGQVERARAVFAVIERFVGALLESIDPRKTRIVVTSDHGHLEQVGFTRGHPKSKVPTWFFGARPEEKIPYLRTPETIFQLLAQQS